MDSIIKRKILVVNDVEATRSGIEELLKRDGYCVKTAQNEQDAVLKVCQEQADLILITLDGEAAKVIAAAGQVRKLTGLSDAIPVIIFCADGANEAAETLAGVNIYLTCPDNFNQLRDFIRQLLA